MNFIIHNANSFGMVSRLVVINFIDDALAGVLQKRTDCR